MATTGNWRHAIEIHPEGWHFPAGKTWIAGWLVSASGRAPADVRAWIDERPILGLCGLPRPDVERSVSQREGPPHAGFSFLLEAHREARTLRLEVCDLHGTWEEFASFSITAADDAVLHPSRPHADVTKLVTDLLKEVRRRPAESIDALARRVVAAHISNPLDTLPNPPFFGALEEPAATGRVKYGRLMVTGWLAHREREVTGLTAFVDPMHPVPIAHGLPRHDVGGLFAELRGTEHSQFLGHVDLPSGLPLPAALRIFADLDDGRRELVFTRRFHPEWVTGSDAGLPPFSTGLFVRAVFALRRAAAGLGLPIGGLASSRFRDGARRAWETYKAEAPHPIAPAGRTDPESRPVARRPLRIVVVTHNLKLEGAPWFALELARFLASQPGWTVRAVSAEDGPLRPRFEEAGMPVQIVDAGRIFAASSPTGFESAIAGLAATVDWGDADLVIANTMVAFWAVHLARHLRKRSVLYIHESASARRFFSGMLAPEIVPLAEEAFGAATRVVFIAGASMAVHARLERRRNFRLIPSWIDVERIERFAGSHEPATLRALHEVPRDAVVFANIGTVCERKGQHVFVQAVDILQRSLGDSPAIFPPLSFFMVGGRPGQYLDSIRHEIGLRGLMNVKIVEEVPDTYPFYHLADVFVCSSFEEAFPRVLLEAAVFDRPIVSTDVNGITEMVGSDEAWLVPPGDPQQLADAMRAALEAHVAGDRSRPRRARLRVLERYDARNSLPRHAVLALEAASGR